MSKNRDEKPGYIFCNTETKAVLLRSGVEALPDNVYVVADIVPYGYCVVTTKDDFLGWLFAKGNDHDIWTIPEEEEHEYY